MASPAVKLDSDIDLRPTRGANEVVVFAEDLAGHRTEVKLDATFAHRISAGGSHTGAVVNGHLYAWGRNNLGQLGLGAGDTVARLLPEVVPTLDNVTAVDFRQNQSLALRQDGALFVWGSNADGRLGLGTPTTQDVVTRSTPTQVTALSGVLAATFGYDHTLVLLEDGTVRAFGDNSLGQLGVIAVPHRPDAQEPEVLRGKALFGRAGCADCHRPSFTTGAMPSLPELGEQRIYPYTDLLLHAMGPDLADGRPDHEATGDEFRTPPLWGIGLTKLVTGQARFLHDGRARSVEEATLWHGGEAEPARAAFTALSAEDRAALSRFVLSL